MADDLSIMGLGPIGPLKPQTERVEKSATPAASQFGEILRRSIQEVTEMQGKADETIRQLLSGEIQDVNEALLAVEKADVAFNTMMQIRNKIVAAYEEIMRMQI